MKSISILKFLFISMIGIFQACYADPVNIDGYTKNIITVSISDTANKEFIVNGSTCKVEMKFFTGSASGHITGNIVREYYMVTKRYEDGRTEARARYVIGGPDPKNVSSLLFIEDNFIGYDDQDRPITRPTIITNSSELTWLHKADLIGIVEEKGYGKRFIHIMSNGKELTEERTVYIPDKTRNFNKKLFTFDISVLGADEVYGKDQALAKMIGFTCSANTDFFKGEGIDVFADARLQYPGQAQTLSAIYILQGRDDEGHECKVFIENNGVDLNGINTEPIIITDNPKWAWIEKAPLHGNSSTQNNLFQIHLYTFNDATLWASPEPEPEPELTEEEKEKKNKREESDKEKQLGNTAYKKKDFETALTHYAKAYEIDETNIAVLTNKAAVLYEMGNYDEAIKVCEDAVEHGREVFADFKIIAR